ncbi:hypothetical protein VNO77_32119 [Canavalia gladiata]|uniref:Uncharacterized protein n=1 Tax=Canavalia gladiata TaxID=3824 RepID=A0AAN9KTW9_CANGL
MGLELNLKVTLTWSACNCMAWVLAKTRWACSKNPLGCLHQAQCPLPYTYCHKATQAKSRRMGLLSILVFPSLTSFEVAVRAGARCSYLGNLRPVGRSPSNCFINIIQSLRVIRVLDGCGWKGSLWHSTIGMTDYQAQFHLDMNKGLLNMAPLA